jgi:hypothetical protein
MISDLYVQEWAKTEITAGHISEIMTLCGVKNTFETSVCSKANNFSIRISFLVLIFKPTVRLYCWVCKAGDKAWYLLYALAVISLQVFPPHAALRQMLKKLLRLSYLVMVSWVNLLLRNYTELLCSYYVSFLSNSVIGYSLKRINYFQKILNLTEQFTFICPKGKGKAISLHAMEALGGERRYSSYSFSTSVLDRGEWSASRPGRAFTPGERTPGTHCTGGWVGPRAGLDTEVRGKIV